MQHAHLALISLALISLLPAQERGGRRGRQRAAPTLQHLIHEVGKFESAAVGREMPFGVYLPKDYYEKANAKRQWPLVIWLHGMWEDHERFHYRGGAPLLDQAVGDGSLPPCVFVLANGGRTSMYINAGDNKNYQDLVQRDLLAHVTKTYRVIDDRQQRALMGISMGGMAALRIGFTAPTLFGTVAVHSSAVFPPDPQQLPPQLLRMSARFGLDEVFGNPIDAELWAKTNPLGLAATVKPAELKGLRLYFDAGTNDRWQFGPANKALHQALQQRKVEHTWTLVEGGGHAWGSGFKDESLLASLKFVGDGFKAAAKAAAKGASAPAKDSDK